MIDFFFSFFRVFFCFFHEFVLLLNNDVVTYITCFALIIRYNVDIEK